MTIMRPRLGVHRKLYVGAPRLNPDFPDDRKARVAHQLVFAVGERQGGRYRYGVAVWTPSGSKFSIRAYHHALVLVVAHDLHFKFLPTEQALLDEHLGDGGRAKAKRHHVLVFLAVVGNSSARSAERVARAYDDRKFAPFFNPVRRLFCVVDNRALGNVEPDFEHRLPEFFAVFALLDGLLLCAYQLHAVLFENPRALKA